MLVMAIAGRETTREYIHHPGAAVIVPILEDGRLLLERQGMSGRMIGLNGAMTALGAGALALPGWEPLRLADAWVIVAVGVTGFLGQVAITEAFRHGEASVVAPFEYSALGWGLGLDLLVWGVLPDGWTFAGAGIIVASGLYIVHRERVRAAEALRLEALIEAGAAISGLWCEDWVGIRETSFGRRLFWDWQWNAARYPDLPARIRHQWSLNPLDASSMYGGTDKGYVDYPFYKG